ncbi:SapC family protein [Bosea thiooxidans]
MFDDASLYEQPTPLSNEWGHHRIYAPQAYPNIRCALTLPLVMGEAAAVAQQFPICWRQEGAGVRLVALIHMLTPEKRHLAPMLSNYPLIGQAYPFVVPDEAMIERQLVVFDRSLADSPTDIGAPLILATGRLSKASIIRARTALQLGRAMAGTERLSQELQAAGFLEPWPLNFDLGHGVAFERSDLFVLSAKALTDPALFSFVESYGVEAGLFLPLHRISLFRASQLLAQAKRAVAAAAAGSGRAAAVEEVLGA